MKSIALMITLALFGFSACKEDNKQPSQTQTTQGEQPRSPDNTVVNERDKSGTTMLPTDQSESPADREITQNIRKSIIADNALSPTAKNVKIITSGGVVTLRGPVKSQAEKTTTADQAQQAPNMKRVDNQLDVQSEPSDQHPNK
jgi:hyperosmotically inducible periplasmic protein